MRFLAVLPLVAYAWTGNNGRAAEILSTARSPVLVELFTSEGCSSCPPIDALVERMDAAQPFPGEQLIVLSEHVDYWNHDGWKDPYSSAQSTERQAAYVHGFNLSEPYTPQIIVNGSAVVKSYDPQQIAQVFEKAVAAPHFGIRITAVDVTGADPPVVRAHIEADANPGPHHPDIYLAVALDHAESQVSAGENNGKRLSHVAIVEYLKKVGKLDSGKPFAQDCEVKLKKSANSGNLRVVAFIQESGPGQVLGAALWKAKGASTP